VNHLCSCPGACWLWRKVDQAQRLVDWWDEAAGEGAPEQPGWLDAVDALTEARARWLDHVLATAPCLKPKRRRKRTRLDQAA
jgi:hypothetical protein